MNVLCRSTAPLAVVAAVTLSPAMAEGPRPSGSSQAGFLSLPADRAATKVVPHYEWQYHYTGRHANWQGHWVLVKPPTGSAGLAENCNSGLRLAIVPHPSPSPRARGEAGSAERV